MSSITINGQLYTTGMRLRSIRSEMEGIPTGIGLEVSIAIIDGSSSMIGVVREEPSAGWNDLHGSVADNTGLWFQISNFEQYFEVIGSNKFTVVKNYKFGRTELKGKTGHVIHKGNDGLFVEMDEHINGLSCDGLGKTGHCALIPQKYIEFEANKKSKKVGGKK